MNSFSPEQIDAGCWVAAQLRPQDMPVLKAAGLRSVIGYPMGKAAE